MSIQMELVESSPFLCRIGHDKGFYGDDNQ